MNNQEKENRSEAELIDITEYLLDFLKVVSKMWIWFLIFSIAGSALFYVKGRVSYVPMYTASATFTVNIREEQGRGDDTVAFFDNETAEQMATTFPYILTSGVLQRRVEEELGRSVSTGAIKAEVLPNTNLLTISVTDKDPENAYEVLTAVIDNYPEISEVIVGKTKMEMLDETGVPMEPDNPKAFGKDAIKGAAVGVILAAIWSVLLVFTRRTVRKESDVQTRLHTRCLGTIPKITMKRRTKTTAVERIVITDEKYEEQLQENFRIIRNKIERYSHEYGQKVFLITSAVAGEGKSTVAVNLALTLAKAGQKVVLIDCDLRHPSDGAILGIEEGNGLVNVLNRTASLKDCLLKAQDLGLGAEMKFMVIPGGKPIPDGSGLLGSKAMGKVIEHMKQWADIVILDSAPAGIITDAAIIGKHADAAVFVVRKDFARVDYIMDGMEHMAESHVPIIGSILNGV